MSQYTSNPISKQLTSELRHLHIVMQAISILGEQPAMQVVAFGKIWRYADLLQTAVRYAELAQLHGFDITPFKQWFMRDYQVFEQYGVAIQAS